MPQAGAAAYLFSAVAVASPLEELEALYQKRLANARNLGQASATGGLTEAYAVARRCLETALAGARAGPGEAPEDGPPAGTAGAPPGPTRASDGKPDLSSPHPANGSSRC